MTWSKSGSIWVRCEPIYPPDEPATLKRGWTIKETQGVAIMNARAYHTPLQRLYMHLLKYNRNATCLREGNAVRVLISPYNNGPEIIEILLEPQDDTTQE
jgi:hypothetical protein